jgi:DinB superfamily
MKFRRQLEALEPMILDPLEGLRDAQWHEAPAGRWTIAQILQHLALGMDAVVQLLEERKERTDLERRASARQQLLRHLLLGIGRIPPGRKTPAATRPADRPDPKLATAQYRMAVERLATRAESLPAEQQARLYVRHPHIGDLNLPEWVRFFYVHNRHHAHQIAVRLRWLRRRPPARKARRPRGK